MRRPRSSPRKRRRSPSPVPSDSSVGDVSPVSPSPRRRVRRVSDVQPSVQTPAPLRAAGETPVVSGVLGLGVGVPGIPVEVVHNAVGRAVLEYLMSRGTGSDQ
jgi:hypothetical protein